MMTREKVTLSHNYLWSRIDPPRTGRHDDVQRSGSRFQESISKITRMEDLAQVVEPNATYGGSTPRQLFYSVSHFSREDRGEFDIPVPDR
jgi:hypothetical protein